MTDTSPWSSEFVQTTSAEAATQPLDRRRGQFNFLTWPFFLAQVFAIEQALGDALRPPVIGDEATRSDRSEGIVSGFETFPLEPRHKASADDGEAPSAVGSRTALLYDRLQLDKIATPPPEQENRESGKSNETQATGGGGSTSGGSEASPGAETDGAANVSAGLTIAPPDFEPQGSGFVPFVLTSTGDFSIPIEAFTAPTAGTTSLLNDVATVLGAAAPIAQVAFQPLHTLSSGLASVADYVLGLAAPVVQTVNPVLTTASDTVANLTGNVLEAAAPIGHTVGPVLDTAAGTVADLTDTALEVVTPIVNATDPLLATATNAVADLGNGLLQAAAPIMQSASPVLNTATHAITDLTDEVLGAAAPIAHGLEQVLAPATNTVAGLTDSTLENVAPIVAHGGPAVSTAITTVAHLAGDLHDIIPSVFHAANPVLANPTNSLGDDALGTSITVPLHAVAAETEGALGAVSNLTDNVLRDATPVPDAADQVLANGPGKIADLLKGFDSLSGEHVFAQDAQPNSQSLISNTSNIVPDVDNVLPLGHGLVSDGAISFHGKPTHIRDDAQPDTQSSPMPESTAIVGEDISKVVDEVSDGLPLGHGLAADGAILFDNRPSPAAAKDDLSGDGGYSQYAVAMRTDAVDTTDRAGPNVGRENLGVGDLQPDRDHDQDASRSQDPGDDKHDNPLTLGHATSALDDIVLRGHDGLL